MRRLLRLMHKAYTRGWRHGYDDALFDLAYDDASRRQLFWIMMRDGYQPRRRPK